MSIETVKRVEAKIQSIDSIPNDTKAELLRLLLALESEINALSKTESELSETISGFIERSLHEATRRKKNPELLRISLAGLTASVKGFEASHQRLVADVNGICTVLANIGI